ncbi:methanogenesis marker 12 protein [Methanimicrococcus blatticola]|uniref:Putative methanogenesis marker protein 12 n=1 Tax=Methanimicrococcus blatticola TaxID=91560 RepID=A0A484F3B2_9EURY|nr:methanogenesis marker 12 protein [Methanimicrococcus blatticola]MBZ3935417.1 methanogenesis marker 12 protein [Methanimicrococcus blatticola]MCC2508486.1 methanogenesis marker 12 protein [Methanimicrococcus blatticola]TDQ67793.1 putative methanogenesis marker protein 12 [Methanimicrococcus blatticola]
MIFMGVDHGTSAIRFAVLDHSEFKLVRFFEIPRETAGSLSLEELQKRIEENMGMPLSDIDLACLTYSMGDGISQIEDIRFVQNRGVSATSGVGKITNAGTKIFDLFAKDICPAVLLPGLHQKNEVTDSRMQHFSHQASPEKIGIAFHAQTLGHRRFILSDIGSNTVTMAVSDGKILGAIDAAIFAPGTRHGPLDVNAIREIDAGNITGNDAFSSAGVGDDKMKLAFFAAMEIAALDVLMKDYGAEDYVVLVAGSGGEDKEVRREISRLLQKPVESLGKWSAALGCAEMAWEIVSAFPFFSQEKEIFGIPVHFDFKDWQIRSGYGLEQ